MARVMALGVALALIAAVVGAAAVAYGQQPPTEGGVEPEQLETCPPACYGGLIIMEPGEMDWQEFDVPFLAGPSIWVNVTAGDGWFVDFDSDIPVIRVAIAGGAAAPACNVFNYGTDPLVLEDYGLYAPGYVQPTRIEICFAGGGIRVCKFEDLDKDGVHDEGEPMLPGWEFSLTALYEEPWLVHTGVTNEWGDYLFPTLEPGIEHVVTETLKPGWISTTGVTQDGIYVEGDEIVEVWFGNAREEAPPEDEEEEEEEEEEELLPKTGIDPLPLVGGAAALASVGVAGLLFRRRKH